MIKKPKFVKTVKLSGNTYAEKFTFPREYKKMNTLPIIEDKFEVLLYCDSIRFLSIMAFLVAVTRESILGIPASMFIGWVQRWIKSGKGEGIGVLSEDICVESVGRLIQYHFIEVIDVIEKKTGEYRNFLKVKNERVGRWAKENFTRLVPDQERFFHEASGLLERSGDFSKYFVLKDSAPIQPQSFSIFKKTIKEGKGKGYSKEDAKQALGEAIKETDKEVPELTTDAKIALFERATTFLIDLIFDGKDPSYGEFLDEMERITKERAH